MNMITQYDLSCRLCIIQYDMILFYSDALTNYFIADFVYFI